MTSDALIYLETDEEITAVIDRLRETEATEIRLVVPKGALVLQSLVSLKLLKREAETLKKAIALVTQDPVGLRLGEQVGLSVYAKPKDDRPLFAAGPLFKDAPATEDEAVAEPEEPQEETDPVAALAATLPEESPEGIAIHRYDFGASPAAPAVSLKPARPPRESVNQLLGRRSKESSPSLLRWLKIGLVVVVLGALGLLLFLEFVPRSVVTLVLATEPLTQTVTITAETDQPTVDTATARIPARLLETDLASEQSVPATGKKQVGNKATGTLNLLNYWDSNAQNLAAGTTVRVQDGTIFLSTAAATIPGATTTLREGKVVTTPGKTTVTIEAEQSGTDANGKSGTFTIPSLPPIRQDKIYGEAVASTSGGTSKEVTIVTQADRDGVKNLVLEELTKAAAAKFGPEAGSDRLLTGAIAVEITNEDYSKNSDDQADTLRLKAQAHAKALIFADQNLTQATVAALKQSISSARDLVLDQTDQVVTTIHQLDLARGQLVIDAAITTRTALHLELDDLKDQITGLSVTDADTKLHSVAGIMDVTILHRPRWLKTLPKHASQITLTVTHQAASLPEAAVTP